MDLKGAETQHHILPVVDLHNKILDVPPGPNSFDFMQSLGKFSKIVCSPPGGLVPHLRKILDPPLIAYSLTLQYFEPIQKDKIANMVKFQNHVYERKTH